MFRSILKTMVLLALIVGGVLAGTYGAMWWQARMVDAVQAPDSTSFQASDPELVAGVGSGANRKRNSSNTTKSSAPAPTKPDGQKTDEKTKSADAGDKTTVPPVKTSDGTPVKAPSAEKTDPAATPGNSAKPAESPTKSPPAEEKKPAETKTPEAPKKPSL